VCTLFQTSKFFAFVVTKLSRCEGISSLCLSVPGNIPAGGKAKFVQLFEVVKRQWVSLKPCEASGAMPGTHPNSTSTAASAGGAFEHFKCLAKLSLNSYTLIPAYERSWAKTRLPTVDAIKDAARWSTQALDQLLANQTLHRLHDYGTLHTLELVDAMAVAWQVPEVVGLLATSLRSLVVEGRYICTLPREYHMDSLWDAVKRCPRLQQLTIGFASPSKQWGGGA
jgi:hypothetical protein